MSVVYRMTDRRRLKIDDITVTISPLNYKTKADMQAMVMKGNAMDACVTAIKHSIKDIDGLVLADGSKYELEFDTPDQLSENCVNDLLNIPQAAKLNLISLSLINGIPQKEFIDPQTNEVLEGVKFVDKGPAPKKGKPRQ